jgi:hypothetical protein
MRTAMILTLLVSFLLTATAIAQQPGDTLWTRTYGGDAKEYGYRLRPTTDGGYIWVGQSSSFGAGLYDIWLVKLDADGDTLWTRTYGGVDYEAAIHVEQTDDDGYIIGGYSMSFGAGGFDVYLVKTDEMGEVVWTCLWGESADEWVSCVTQTTDGGYIVSGNTTSFNPNFFSDAFLMKVEESGDIEWTRIYGGDATDAGRYVVQTPDEGYLLCGLHVTVEEDVRSLWLVRTDETGDTLWTRTYDVGDDDDLGQEIKPTSDGGYIVGGWAGSTIPWDYDVLLLKLDANGDSLWSRQYGDGLWNFCQSVEQTSDGGYILTGLTNGRNDIYDIWLLKTDANGDTLWTRTYGGSGDDRAFSVFETTDGNYIIGGHTDSFGSGGYDFYALKVVGDSDVFARCGVLTPVLCRGKNFYFQLNVFNATGGNVSGTLNFRGYTGYDCDPLNTLVTIPRSKTYVPGWTTESYFFKVPNAVVPGQYSASVDGTLGGVEVSCCMNVDILDCSPWRTGTNTEWGLVEVHRGEAALPTVTTLHQNYPNPFNASTTISFSLAEHGNVSLKVYDLGGHLVASLVNGQMRPGEHVMSWDASEVSSGVYFYRLTAGDYSEAKRMMLVK